MQRRLTVVQDVQSCRAVVHAFDDPALEAAYSRHYVAKEKLACSQQTLTDDALMDSTTT
ncbi:MAG: hypothetical protein JWM11_3400 [Planctomycetaceae bacterium]|nr:hypothetical protein [Planctomycetaceae bacterium]